MGEEQFEKKDIYNPSFKDRLVDITAKTFNIDNPDGEPIIIQQFENNPERIVKISRKEHIYRFSPEDIAPVESAKTIEIQNEAKKHFEELENKYGIPVAPFEYKICLEEDSNENILYCISDKIHGDNLITKFKEKDLSNHIGNVDGLLTSLISYFKDKYKEGSYYLGDVANIGNYIYGRKKDEKEDKLYLIDTEPILVGLKTPQEKEFFNKRVLETLLSQIEFIEKETGKELVAVRKKYNDLAEDIKENPEKQSNQPKPLEESKSLESEQETSPPAEISQKPPENLNESIDLVTMRKLQEQEDKQKLQELRKQLNITKGNPETSIEGKIQESPIRELLDNNPELAKIYKGRSTTHKIVFDESGRILSDGQTYEDNPKMRALVELADAIRKGLPDVQDGYVRLWRGNRPDEVSHNPSYTNSLEGIALPFLRGYSGVLSYIDVPQEEAKNYMETSGVAKDSEFMLPSEVVKNVKIVGFTPEETDEIKKKARPLSATEQGKGWTNI